MKKTLLYYDFTLLMGSLINLILWILRAYTIDQVDPNLQVLKFLKVLFYPMVVLLFLLPTLIVMRTFRKRVSLYSYPFMALIVCVLTLCLIFYKN